MFECGNFHSSTYLLNSLTTIYLKQQHPNTGTRCKRERSEKKLWTHSESSEIATAIVSTAWLCGNRSLRWSERVEGSFESAHAYVVFRSPMTAKKKINATRTYTHTHRNGREKI